MSDAEEQLARELFLRASLPGLTGDSATRLAEVLRPVTARPGELLLRAGEAPDHFYFLIDGEVAMEAEGKKPWLFGPRSIVGIIDAIIGRKRSRAARATRDSRLLDARSVDWFELLDDDPRLARGATLGLARQIHEQWAHLPGQSSSPALLPPVGELPFYEKLLVLRDSSLLSNAGLQATASLAMIATEIRLEAEEMLFRAGSELDTLYIVAYGAVELVRAEPAVRVVHGSSELLGGPAALARALSFYEARALAPSVVLRISDDDYHDQAEAHPELTRAALAYLVRTREHFLELSTSDPPA
jgi:CRP-like cAMP-binding protein